jgi:hypothetical protein
VFSVILAAAVLKQRRGKHVSAEMNQHSKIEELLETVIYTRSVPRGYQWDKFRAQFSRVFRVEAVSNTSTVALREVGGDEMASLESETVKYGHESHGTRTRTLLRWREPGTIVNVRPVLSSERTLDINKSAVV